MAEDNRSTSALPPATTHSNDQQEAVSCSRRRLTMNSTRTAGFPLWTSTGKVRSIHVHAFTECQGMLEQ